MQLFLALMLGFNSIFAQLRQMPSATKALKKAVQKNVDEIDS